VVWVLAEVGFGDFDGTKPISRKWVWIVGVAGGGKGRFRIGGVAGHGPAPLGGGFVADDLMLGVDAVLEGVEAGCGPGGCAGR
jgi:hypothetical protein